MNLALKKLASRGAPTLADQLIKAGWTFEVGPSNMAPSAWTDCGKKQIVVHPRISKRTNVRDYKYVLPHEMGHARDCMTNWPSKWLIDILDPTKPHEYDFRECREIVAERVAMLVARNDRMFVGWLRVSLNFHKKHGNQIYSLQQIRHPATTELAKMLIGQSTGGVYFHFIDKIILPIRMDKDPLAGFGSDGNQL